MQQVSLSLLSHGRYFNHQHATIYIFQPSLRTRRCVGFWTSSCPRVRFPCRNFECPRAFRRHRIVHGWGTCRDSWCQVHRRRLWFCHNPVFFFLFLHPVRHRFGAARQAELLSAADRAEMADVEQMKKIVLFVTCENYLWSICPASWCLVSTYLIWIVVSKIILSNNQSRTTLWVLDTCLIVGLRPLMIILITASLSSEMYNIAPNRENFAFDGTQSTLFR